MNQKPKYTEPATNSNITASGYNGLGQFINMHKLMRQDNDEEDLYFYHGDLPKAFGIGSSSWITDGSGNACTERSRSVNQFLAYMPFGESFINQRNADGHDIRFKFTGKERDAETGMDYFGARYYASDISVWLSVDPLASKYPGISPYAYVFNNPVMFIDKWGLEGGPVQKEIFPSKQTQSNDWLSQFKEPIAYLSNLEPVIITSNKSSTSELKKASFLSKIGNSINNFFKGLDRLFQGNNTYNQADGITLMAKSLDAGNNENAHLKPKKGQKKYDGSIVYADYLMAALGSRENNISGLNVAKGIVDGIDFLKNLRNQTEPFPRKEDNVSTVPIRRVKPISIRVVVHPSGGRDSFRVFLNDFDTCFKIDSKGNIKTMLRTKAEGYGEYK